jgi:hypothetical protein
MIGDHSFEPGLEREHLDRKSLRQRSFSKRSWKMSHVERLKKRAVYAIVRTTPPSTRKEVPVVADACSEQT